LGFEVDDVELFELSADTVEMGLLETRSGFAIRVPVTTTSSRLAS